MIEGLPILAGKAYMGSELVCLRNTVYVVRLSRNIRSIATEGSIKGLLSLLSMPINRSEIGDELLLVLLVLLLDLIGKGSSVSGTG